MKNDGFTFRKRARSFKFAFNGIKLLITKEHNAWIVAKNGLDGLIIATILAGVFLILMGLCHFGSLIKFIPYTITTGFTSGIAVTIVIGAVLAAEAVNSSIEALADLVSPEYNEAIKRTKDLAAGAVLLMAIAAAIVGFIIFIPKIATIF